MGGGLVWLHLWLRTKAMRKWQTSRGSCPAWQGEIWDPVMGNTKSQKKKQQQKCIETYRGRKTKRILSLRGNGVEVSPQVRAGCGGGGWSQWVGVAGVQVQQRTLGFKNTRESLWGSDWRSCKDFWLFIEDLRSHYMKQLCWCKQWRSSWHDKAR